MLPDKEIMNFLANTANIAQVINAYDGKPDDFTLGELKKQLRYVTGGNPLGNQYWGMLALYALIPIKQFNRDNQELSYLSSDKTDILWFIRDCLAHNKVSFDDCRIMFTDANHKSGIKKHEITYVDFPWFIQDYYVPFVENVVKAIANKSKN